MSSVPIERLQVRSLRLVNDRVNEMATMVVLAELPLVVLMLLLGSFVAALVCLGVTLLAALATNLGRRQERNAILELRPRLIVARVRGLPALQLAVDEIDSAMRIGPREALLRAGARKVVIELQPDSPPEELDALFAHLQVGPGRSGRSAATRRRAPVVAIVGLKAPRRATALMSLLWVVDVILWSAHDRSLAPLGQTSLATAVSYLLLVAGQLLVLALIAAYMDNPTVTLGENELTLRRRGVERSLDLARIGAIERHDGLIFPSITLALVDGSEERLVPLAREETAAVGRALEQRLARNRRGGTERRSEPPTAREDASRPSEARNDVIALERRGALDWLGGVASMTIGADGLLLRRGHQTTFVSFALLRAVSVTPVTDGARGSRAEILLHTEDGRSRVVGTSREPMDVGSLSLRLAQAVRAHHGDAPIGAEQLARGDRSIAEWRAELAVVRGSKVPTLAFRAAALEDEHLHEILTSSRASLEERIGAALALRQTTDVRDETELRVRIAVEASATADPRLREALEVVAAEEIDDERLAAVLLKMNG